MPNSPRKARCPGCKALKSNHAFARPSKHCSGDDDAKSLTDATSQDITVLKQQMKDVKEALCSISNALQHKSHDDTTEVQASAEASSTKTTLNDLRSIDTLETKVNKQIAELGLQQPTDSSDESTTSSTDEDSDYEKKGSPVKAKFKSKGKLRSGLARKASDIVSHYVLWPHEYLLNAAPTAHELTYSDLSYQQLVAGELEIITSGPISKVERTGRLRHLADLTKDATVYPWPTVSNYHKTVLQQIERGQLRWNDDFDDLHSRFIRKIPITENSHRALVNPAERQRVRTRYCGAFQSNRCEKDSDHIVDGTTEKHICGPCLRLRAVELRHSAIECPRRPPRSEQEKKPSN